MKSPARHMPAIDAPAAGAPAGRAPAADARPPTPPAAWIGRDGRPVSCREKLKVLEENRAELAIALRDAFDDAVIMGVDPVAMRAELAAMVARLKSPNES